jgi:AcrR family transcriptional regulator
VRPVTQGERRTQKERREATVAKLLQATIEALGEVGYARASVNEICRRAGVSTGGLFRHFATREDLMVAAAGEVAQRQLDDAKGRLVGLSFTDRAGLEAAVRHLREAARSPSNAVFYELITASRTDPGLATKMRPALAAYYLQILKLAADLFGITSDPDREFETALFGLLWVIDAEALGRVFGEDPHGDEQRLRWLLKVAEATLPTLHRPVEGEP